MMASHSDEDRSYYHGRINRDDAVQVLTDRGFDGSFLLRMSTTQDGVYTISVMQGNAVRHIRVMNTARGGFSLSRGDPPAESIWELIDGQMNKTLTNTLNSRDAVALRYPLAADSQPIAPDLLNHAGEAGMDPTEFDDMAASFLEGGLSAKEIVRRRSVKHGVPVHDVVRQTLGPVDPDLERFMNGAISAEELRRRREQAVAAGEGEFVEAPLPGNNPFSEPTFDDGFDPDNC